MDKLTPDEIAHLTEGDFPHDKADCPHDKVVTIEPEGTLYICLKCGMESTDLSDFRSH
ncbi:hypothetical protein [Macrococcus lamae]|uniref:hypothetical protein n=1 Tax=Macrococcus lamae TaxID=198484 RepID=UPI00140D49FA|nr:hypothetical protein [Macrococcus lamae]